MRFALYLRCSSDLQDDSIETQDTLCREYVEKAGGTVARVYSDPDVPASKVPMADRAAGALLLRDAAQKDRAFDAVVVLAYDRAWRGDDEIACLAWFDRHKCPVYSVRESYDRKTTSGSLVHGIMREIRKFETRQLGDRVREHNMARMRQGLFPGGRAPLGYSMVPGEGRLEVNDRATDAVEVFRAYVQANGNMHAAARSLNLAGIPTATGGAWRQPSLRNLIRSSIYRRQYQCAGQRVDAQDTIPPLIPQDLLDMADILFETRAAAPARQSAGTRVYSGLLTCAHCGLTLVGHTSRVSRGAQVYLGWRCTMRAAGVCQTSHVSELRLDRAVVKALVELRRIDQERILESVRRQPHTPPATAAKRRRLEASRERVIDGWVSGVIAQEDRDRRLAEIDAELARLQEARPVSRPTYADAWRDITLADWQAAPPADRRRLLLSLRVRITVEAGEERAITVQSDIGETRVSL
jgi:DNA invertase Pin-like site-specific DNA recombinase